MLKLSQAQTKYEQQEFCFDLEVKAGEKIAIVGKSGSGKTTLLNLIAGFLPLTGGKIEINDRIVNDLLPNERNLDLVFQFSNLFPHLRVRDNLALALLNHKELSKEQKATSVNQVLAQVGLSEIADKLPHECSGGQVQRASIARSLLSKKEYLLLDEPFASLDPENRRNIGNLLAELPITLLIVTHNLEDVEYFVDRVIEIADGKIVSDRYLKHS